MTIFKVDLGYLQNDYILDFIAAKDDGGVGDNWKYKACKAPVKSSPPTYQYPFFTGWMPFLLPIQHVRALKGKLTSTV